MSELLHKKSILKKTVQVGSNTLASRLLGLVREILLMRFLGVGVAADAFNAAFLIPNSLRKIFAEGALTAAFVPTFVASFHKGGKEKANELITLGFIFFESLVLLLCVLVIWQPEYTIKLLVPGFSPEQMAGTVQCLRILMPFIFFVSTSSLLAGALQSANHFFIPAFCPVLLNIVFIGGVLICLTYGLSVEYLCYAILFGGFLQLVAHIFQYFAVGFSFKKPEPDTMQSFKHVLKKFLPCFFSMSIMELSLIVDLRFASYLHVGALTLVKYTNRLMGIPLGVFAVAFSTILLTHFSKVHLIDPKRLHFYLVESMKFVFWVTIPATLIMCYFAENIFVTLFVSFSDKFPKALIPEAGQLLMAFLSGLFFFSINKILLNLFYSFHDTKYPTVLALVALGTNIVVNYLLVGPLGTVGIALGTCIGGVVQMVLSLVILKYRHGFTLYLTEFFEFAVRYLLQLLVVLIPLYWFYKALHQAVVYVCRTSPKASFVFLDSFGFWLWVMPLIVLGFGTLYLTRRQFKVQLYFLD